MKKHQLVQQIDSVLAAHATWHSEMVMEIKHGKGPFSPDATTEHVGCFFGDWLESETLDATIRKTEPYSLVRWLHHECHKLMGEIVTLARDGRKSEAIDMLDSQCKGMHGTLERALMAWREQITGRKPVALFAS